MFNLVFCLHKSINVTQKYHKNRKHAHYMFCEKTNFFCCTYTYSLELISYYSIHHVEFLRTPEDNIVSFQDVNFFFFFFFLLFNTFYCYKMYLFAAVMLFKPHTSCSLSDELWDEMNYDKQEKKIQLLILMTVTHFRCWTLDKSIH